MGLNQLPGLPEGTALPPLIPKENLISMYTKYADVVEAPAEAHELMAIAIIAAVLNKNGIVIENGAIDIPMDLWVLIISDSGTGRNTLVGLADPVLQKAELQGLVRKAAWGSPQGFYQNLAEHPYGLYIWPEMSVMLKTFARKDFSGAKEWLTDRYDTFALPDPILYRQLGKGKDTPPIQFDRAPRLNLIATSSGDWLVDSLDQADTTGGFLPRWTIVNINARGKLVPTPAATDQQLREELAKRLREIDAIRGRVVLSQEVREMYEQWYVETYHRFESQPNSALALPFFRRLRHALLKLAVVYEVAESGTLEVSLAAMRRAIAMAGKVEASIFELLPTGMNSEGAALAKITERIKQEGVAGITATNLTAAFQSTKWTDWKGRLYTLRAAGTIAVFHRPSGGRPTVVYVHKEYADAHKKDFPGDKEQ